MAQIDIEQLIRKLATTISTPNEDELLELRSIKNELYKFICSHEKMSYIDTRIEQYRQIISFMLIVLSAKKTFDYSKKFAIIIALTDAEFSQDGPIDTVRDQWIIEKLISYLPEYKNIRLITEQKYKKDKIAGMKKVDLDHDVLTQFCLEKRDLTEMKIIAKRISENEKDRKKLVDFLVTRPRLTQLIPTLLKTYL